MAKRWKATRSFFYTTETGETRVVMPDEFVEDAPEGTIDALLADGLIRETRATPKE